MIFDSLEFSDTYGDFLNQCRRLARLATNGGCLPELIANRIIAAIRESTETLEDALADVAHDRTAPILAAIDDLDDEERSRLSDIFRTRIAERNRQKDQ